MAMKYCPDCGEKYSDTYKYCPFCEEEEILREEKTGRHMGRRTKPSVSPITLILIFLIAVMAVLLIHLLKDMRMPGNTPTEPVTQEEPAAPTEVPGDVEEPVITEEPVEDPEDPSGEVTPDNQSPANSNAKLNREDMTLSGGETFRLVLSGVTTGVTWTSSNEAVATVSDNGTVTPVKNGMCEISATWDGQSRACIVRVVNAGSATSAPVEPGTTTTPSVPNTTTTAGLKAGAAKVIHAESGVYIRSGAGTSYQPLATVKNGADVKVVKSAGDGWYEITFIASGGKTTTGYMKEEYLQNK